MRCDASPRSSARTRLREGPLREEHAELRAVQAPRVAPLRAELRLLHVRPRVEADLNGLLRVFNGLFTVVIPFQVLVSLRLVY